MIYSEEYIKYVEYCNKNNIKLNYTRTQYLFATFLLENQYEINKIGELESVFKEVRTYLKK